MNVILLERVGKLGNVGDVANVKAGYARNYLFPFGVAVPATKQNLENFEDRKADLMAADNEKLAAAQARAEKINGMEIVMEVNASDEGRLFGSVGTKDIAEAIVEKGGDVSKSEVQLPHGALREVGIFDITLDLGFDVHAEITLKVLPIGGSLPEPEVDDYEDSDETDQYDAPVDEDDSDKE